MAKVMKFAWLNLDQMTIYMYMRETAQKLHVPTYEHALCLIDEISTNEEKREVCVYARVHAKLCAHV